MTDQYATIKTYQRAGKSVSEVRKLLGEAYGDKALSRNRVYSWYKMFKEGREDTNAQTGKGHLHYVRTKENVNLLDNLIKEDRRKSVNILVLESGLSRGTVERIIKDDLNLSKLSARWVPRLLDSGHKRQQIAMAEDFKRRHFRQGKAFLDSIVTMDESWISYYTPETKTQSTQWLPKGARPPTKAKAETSTKKIMLIIFFDSTGPIYQHWVPKGQTINSVYYMEVLQTFLVHLGRKRPEKISRGWLLHQDNARPHVSKATSEFMATKGIETIAHAPYSPDLAPCDFWLFPTLKNKIAGTRFQSDTEVKTAVQGVLQLLSADGLQFVFEKWMARLDKCQNVAGDYVEK